MHYYSTVKNISNTRTNAKLVGISHVKIVGPKKSESKCWLTSDEFEQVVRFRTEFFDKTDAIRKKNELVLSNLSCHIRRDIC